MSGICGSGLRPAHPAPMIERVADAIEMARCPDREGPYGLYDYSSYQWVKPYHVRDFRDPASATYGDCVFRSQYRASAEAEYTRLTRAHIALAAIEAMELAKLEAGARPEASEP